MHLCSTEELSCPACCCRQEEANGAAGASEVYEQYCSAIAETAAWGGQVELGALAALLQRRITVYSVGMPAVHMGPDALGAKPLSWLSLLGLGPFGSLGISMRQRCDFA